MNDDQSIREFIVRNFLYGDEDRLGGSTSFLNDGIVDSTGVLELVTFLEETYGISVQDDEMVPANLDSLDNIRNYLAKKLSSQATAGSVQQE